MSKGDAASAFVHAMRAIRLSPNFTAEDLCCAGETWQRVRIWNEPEQQKSWDALTQLCETILEPVLVKFGRPQISYGFASAALFRHIPSGTDKSRDQHAACERGRTGKLLCARQGAAADFRIEGLSTIELANWIADSLPFDRMYFYGATRPLHVSVGPDPNKALVEMVEYEPGRRIPRVRRLDWLKSL